MNLKTVSKAQSIVQLEGARKSFTRGTRAMLGGSLVAVLLSACGPVTQPPPRCTANPCSSVNLSSDPRTLQGHWVGSIEIPQISGETPKLIPITLDLTAQYKNEFYYTVAGIAQLEGKTYLVRGTPTFNYDEKILKPLYSPIPEPPFFELLEGDKVIYSAFYLFWQKDKNYYTGNFFRVNPIGGGFQMTLERSAVPPL